MSWTYDQEGFAASTSLAAIIPAHKWRMTFSHVYLLATLIRRKGKNDIGDKKACYIYN